MNELLLAIALEAAPSDSILCPPLLSEPPWRKYTCFILSRMGIPPDRIVLVNGKEVEVRWD